jgi:hypothetical protein
MLKYLMITYADFPFVVANLPHNNKVVVVKYLVYDKFPL